jgi:hypothetical protein
MTLGQGQSMASVWFLAAVLVRLLRVSIWDHDARSGTE